MQGENIDFYLAMSLDGISVLNDLAGGVTVTLEDDFSAADPAMTKRATLTLQGDQADGRRMDIGHQCGRKSILRLSAQLESGCSRISSSPHRCGALQPYLVSDLAKGQLVNEVWAAKDEVEPGTGGRA